MAEIRRKISSGELDKVLKDTTTIRNRLNAHPHFVYLGKAAIAEVFKDEIGGYNPSELDQAYRKVIEAFSSYPHLDILNNPLAEAVAFVKSTSKSTSPAIRIHKGSELLGVITSNFNNASSKVVRIVQDIINKDLAVGHSVGTATEKYYSTGYKYIQNSVVFRSPLSIKLSVISEAYAIYDLVSSKKYDELLKVYFKDDGSGILEPRQSLNFLVNSLGNVFGTKFLRTLESGKFTKTSALQGFTSFADTYFSSKYKNKSFLSSNLNSAKIEQVRQEVLNAINNIASAHEDYRDRVVDSSTITKEFTKDLAELRVVFTLPQLSSYNSGELATIERSYSNAALKFIKESAAGFVSSPSLINYSLDLIEDILIGGKPKLKSFKQTINGAFESTEFSNVAKPSISVHNIKTGSKVTKVPVTRLRAPSGRFTSLTSLDTLIRARLRETIKKNMVKPRLVNRTGRFAESVKLEGLANREGEITAFLSYMKYPYATFEPGNRQGSESRSPTKLIDVSVREIAKTMVTNRLKTVIV